MSSLNLAYVPNDEISGLPEEVSNWVTSHSGDRYISEFTKNFKNELKEIEVYEDLDVETFTVLTESESKVASESTQKQTKHHMKGLKNFCARKTYLIKLKQCH